MWLVPTSSLVNTPAAWVAAVIARGSLGEPANTGVLLGPAEDRQVIRVDERLALPTVSHLLP